MSGSVEAQDLAKDAAKDLAKDAPKEAAKDGVKAGRPRRPSAAMLKQVVSESEASAPSAPEPVAPPASEPVAAATASPEPVPVPQKSSKPFELRYAAIAVGALVVGTAFGMMAAPKDGSGESFAQVNAALEAGRTEATRLNGEIERLNKSFAALREANEAARNEGKSRGSGLSDRVAKLEQGFEKKLASLGERVEQSDREHAARLANLASQVEKRAAAAAAAPPAPPAQAAPKSEPMQTGSINEPKAKPETIDTWALREVYGGIAVLEDRKRRLIEVAAGETVPGIGRVEAIERRGRAWVVVTKQGLITTQSW